MKRQVPAPAFVLGAAVSVQVGAAVAKSLFDELGPPGVVFLRLLFGGIALWTLQRPRIRGRSAADLRLAAVLGATLACMNLAFYEALDRAPLGIAVTVEFIGPLGVAVISSRRRLDFVWIVLAGAGIALLSEGAGAHVHTLGIALAALAGMFWAIYILIGTRVGRVWAGSSGLAIAMALALVLSLPWGIVSAGSKVLDPRLLGAAVGVGLLSSALPWSLELEAMRRLPTHVFGVMMSLEPAIAAASGFVFLGERLHARALVAIGLVVLASAGASRTARDPVLPPDA
ncbi:MAG: DMT family transporter [Gaiellaceae bacterium]